MDMNQNLINQFINIFNISDEQIRVFFGPGRVNLIGEHTDYNGGHVFPCALSIGTYAIAQKRDDNIIRMYSMNFEHIGMVEFSLDRLRYEEAHNWANYPKGIIHTFQNHGYAVDKGFDVLYYGRYSKWSGVIIFRLD